MAIEWIEDTAANGRPRARAIAEHGEFAVRVFVTQMRKSGWRIAVHNERKMGRFHASPLRWAWAATESLGKERAIEIAMELLATTTTEEQTDERI
jgi:hypothetical protein